MEHLWDVYRYEDRISIYLCEDGGRIGGLQVLICRDPYYIQCFVVSPEWRGHGYGSIIIEDVKRRMNRPLRLHASALQGARTLSQEALENFYRRHGFVQQEPRSHRYFLWPGKD
jgi:GNAT superfamily N-acetyltransferase